VQSTQKAPNNERKSFSSTQCQGAFYNLLQQANQKIGFRKDIEDVLLKQKAASLKRIPPLTS